MNEQVESALVDVERFVATLIEGRDALKSDNERLLANQRASAEAHAADFAALGKAKDALRRICRMVGGQCTDDVSLDFLLHVPDEVAAKFVQVGKQMTALVEHERRVKP